jgi:hypothetical protein
MIKRHLRDRDLIALSSEGHQVGFRRSIGSPLSKASNPYEIAAYGAGTALTGQGACLPGTSHRHRH